MTTPTTPLPAPEFGGYPPPPNDIRPYPPIPSRRGPSGRRTVVTAAAVAAVVGVGAGAGTVAVLGDSDGGPTYVGGLSGSSRAAPAAQLDGSVSAAAAKIGPSVVTIDVRSQSEHDTGSGVVIRADGGTGYVLTNNHVVAAGGSAPSITVTLSDGRSAAAKVVGTDPSDDLAVVKVELGNLRVATFASSAKLVVGQTVIAVGAPLGLSDTVTAGIVSSLARPVATGSSSTEGAVFNAIQTDAAINPGNSGGPLVDLNGNVVGLNAAIATEGSSGGLQVPGQQSGNIGIGFAIPSDEASRVAAELIANGKASHAVLGVSVRDSATSSAHAGAVVTTVTAGGPAGDAGIRVGDTVTVLDGQRIDSADALVAAVRAHAPGERVSVTWIRGSDTRNGTVTLGSATS